jgi:threonine dehydrogenase-like Zn-dependent dehydrogenase
MTTAAQLPKSQYAVQLTGPGTLTLNTAKPVLMPAAHEILLKVEAVGLCFSDLKLLKQFNEHARKSEVTVGVDRAALDDMQSYVPGLKPTVPGHEVVARIIAVGDAVRHHKVGERVLVQADWREVKTAGSNAAFGYNFEGGLQEYTLVDERVVMDSKGTRMLMPVDEQRGASAIALVEPWACVEDSYVTHERQTIKHGGKLLICADSGADTSSVSRAYAKEGPPAHVVTIAPAKAVDQPDEGFDDIVYFGADKAVLNILNDKLATGGLMNVVLGGRSIGAPVHVGVGRVHYGLTRWVGTTGSDASESYRHIPATGEVRDGDSVVVIGAGGPMGQMHVIRDVCTGRKNVSVTGTDFDDPRLESIRAKAEPMAKANGVPLRFINTKTTPLTDTFSYHAIMAPVAAVVAQSVKDAAPGAIINIFAGIPAPVKHDIDLDAYIQKKLYMFGTSGSTIEDMRIVLRKVEANQLNTNASVDAVSGMKGATDGIAAVENRTLAGKIIVYPTLHDMPLIPLQELGRHYPTVAAKLDAGKWCKEAEQELLRVAAR